MGSKIQYSVPQEASRVFHEGILNNPLVGPISPELVALSKRVRFDGSDLPSVPINWRLAESISALKAYEALLVMQLLTKKYGLRDTEVTINTDHATLFFMTPMIASVVQDGKRIPFGPMSPGTQQLFPNEDKHRAVDGLHRTLATNIYKTRDDRFYHIHGSINPEPTLTALGLPMEGEPDDTCESVVHRFQNVVSRLDSAALDELMNEKHRQAGTIAYTADEYLASEQGQQCAKVGLYEILKDEKSNQPASWWSQPVPQSLESNSIRPLAGLKVVDLTRVIAGPAISRSLAEMGASVMRVTSPNITDLSALHQDLNWGKWNCHLDLKKPDDKDKLRELIRDADIVVDGYRPGVMERHGFGRQAIYDLVKGWSRGIIHVRENCYGWHGPWSHRSGWQQISDACCGVSMAYGRAMGHDAAVTPVFPNSDYCTGVCGSAAVLDALVKRSEQGGSYGIDHLEQVALNYYSQWLVRSCGTYPEDVWTELWQRHGSPVFRHYHAMSYLLPSVMKLLREHDAATLFNPAFFQERHAEAINTTFSQVKPIAQFTAGDVQLGYQVGTRGNGVDCPRWPTSLSVEVVTDSN
ncbi:putative alpha methylacyl-CoA racemase [Colletotrichum kahawae]|uniref:Alpha methylacyl-CoA racemase n=1 Tax=Colletotrichum kahawae TaxID=34407 RepID=A0AAD9YLD8_COLKA|nr:putative alpha methylacyl-CoA racemase [Colletotrichum kahawae]